MIRVFMRGEVPGVAPLKIGIVDVRDVASAIILAMKVPEAAGNRFACPAATMWYKDIVDILYKEYGGKGYKPPRIVFPKSKRVLKWQPRSKEEAILSMAESLIEQGFI
jgi:dihydroflavonol-4-reductase